MTERERMQMEIRALEDRLALALSIMQDCEIVAGCDGDADGAEWWADRRRLLIGKDYDILQAVRSEARKFGFYRASLKQVRVWLAESILRLEKAA